VAYEQGAPIPGTLAYANKIIAIEKAYDEIYGQWWQNVSYTPSPNPPATSPPAPTSPPAVQRAQFTIQPKVTTDLVGTIPLLDFWKQFISNQNNSPASTSTSTPSSPVIDNLWRAFLPGG
jgi:hypothetical protein